MKLACFLLDFEFYLSTRPRVRWDDDSAALTDHSFIFLVGVGEGDVLLDAVELLEVEHLPLAPGGLALGGLSLVLERLELLDLGHLHPDLLLGFDLLLDLLDHVGLLNLSLSLMRKLGDGVHGDVLRLLSVLPLLEDHDLAVLDDWVTSRRIGVLGRVDDLVLIVALLFIGKRALLGLVACLGRRDLGGISLRGLVEMGQLFGLGESLGSGLAARVILLSDQLVAASVHLRPLQAVRRPVGGESLFPLWI